MENDQTLVFIKRSPHGDDGDYIQLSEVGGLHWDNRTGGYNESTGRYYVMGYINEEDLNQLNISCSGRHDYSRNGIKICLMKTKTSTAVWNLVLQQAGDDPNPKRPPCTQTILCLLSENPPAMQRAEIRRQLLERGFEPKTIRSAIKTMTKDNRIILEGSCFSPKQIIALPEH